VDIERHLLSPLCPPLYRYIVYSEEYGYMVVDPTICPTLSHYGIGEKECLHMHETFLQFVDVSYHTHYLVSLGLLSDVIDRITLPPSQIKLWDDLGIWSTLSHTCAGHHDISVLKCLGIHYPTLPIYTAYFPMLRGYVEQLSPSGYVFLDDNLRVLMYMNRLNLTPASLVYIDPPFATGGVFAYNDRYTPARWAMMMYTRMALAKSYMAPDSVFMLHLDQRADYIGRYLLTDIFGSDAFVNEIVWAYYSGGIPQGAYPRKHDSIYVYRRGNAKLKVLSRLKPKFQGKVEALRRRGKLFEDEKGPYVWHNRRRGEKEYIYGPISDVWTDIPIINNMARERYGFRTQKPEALLERIVDSATREGDMVFDFFAGIGTLPAVAYKRKRSFIAVEKGEHGHFTYRHKGREYVGMLGRLTETIAGMGRHQPSGIEYTPYPTVIKVFVVGDTHEHT